MEPPPRVVAPRIRPPRPSSAAGQPRPAAPSGAATPASAAEPLHRLQALAPRIRPPPSKAHAAFKQAAARAAAVSERVAAVAKAQTPSRTGDAAFAAIQRLRASGGTGALKGQEQALLDGDACGARADAAGSGHLSVSSQTHDDSDHGGTGTPGEMEMPKGVHVALSCFPEGWLGLDPAGMLSQITRELEVFGPLLSPPVLVDEGRSVARRAVAAFMDTEAANRAVEGLNGVLCEVTMCPEPPPEDAATSEEPGFSILIRGFPQRWAPSDITALLLVAVGGKVFAVDMLTEASESVGCARLRFPDAASALRAVRGLEGQKVAGKPLSISVEGPASSTPASSAAEGYFRLMQERRTARGCVGECNLGTEKAKNTTRFKVYLDELDMPSRPTVEPALTDREVFVDPLPDEEEVKHWLAAFGEAEDVFRIPDHPTGKPGHRGYVRFEEHAAARECVKAGAGEWSESERAISSHSSHPGNAMSVYPDSIISRFLGNGGEEIKSLQKACGATCVSLHGVEESDSEGTASRHAHFLSEFDDDDEVAFIESFKRELERRLAAIHIAIQEQIRQKGVGAEGRASGKDRKERRERKEQRKERKGRKRSACAGDRDRDGDLSIACFAPPCAPMGPWGTGPPPPGFGGPLGPGMQMMGWGAGWGLPPWGPSTAMMGWGPCRGPTPPGFAAPDGAKAAEGPNRKQSQERGRRPSPEHDRMPSNENQQEPNEAVSQVLARVDSEGFFANLPPTLTPAELELADEVIAFVAKWSESHPERKSPNFVHLGADARIRQAKAASLPRTVALRLWIERRLRGKVDVVWDESGQIGVSLSSVGTTRSIPDQGHHYRWSDQNDASNGPENIEPQGDLSRGRGNHCEGDSECEPEHRRVHERSRSCDHNHGQEQSCEPEQDGRQRYERDRSDGHAVELDRPSEFLLERERERLRDLCDWQHRTDRERVREQVYERERERERETERREMDRACESERERECGRERSIRRRGRDRNRSRPEVHDGGSAQGDPSRIRDREGRDHHGPSARDRQRGDHNREDPRPAKRVHLRPGLRHRRR